MYQYSWSEDYSVGNDVIDGHHQRLFELFNDSYNLLFDHANMDQTHKLIHELRIYTIFHFQEEERAFMYSGYPDKEEHLKMHQYFIRQLEDFENLFTIESESVSEELFLFLNQCLIDHIQKTDRGYMSYL